MKLLLLLVCVGVIASTAVGSKLTMRREWKCNHNASTEPARIVHLNEPASYRPQAGGVDDTKHISTRAEELGSFRIHVYYHSSATSLSATTLLQKVVSDLVEFYESALEVRQLTAPIIFDRDCEGRRAYVFNQPPVKRCVTQCATTMCGEVPIPDNHLRACSQCFGSSRSCQTSGSDGMGVANTDFVLYVSAINTASCSGNTIAYASHCHQEDILKRPISGHVNFCPGMIGSANADEAFVVAVAKHEILHALAFSSSLYPSWRDERGMPHSETLRRVEYNNWQTRNGPVTHTVTQLVTPAIVREGRAHFRCSTLTGVEVENQGGSGTALSHWEKRILENEGMTGIVSHNPVFSRLTFALLEDSGWYKVNYAQAQILVWGKDSGCDLPAGSCGGYIQNRLSRDDSISPFCNYLGQQRSCALDRSAVSQCSLVQYTSPLPVEYQYFNNGENFGLPQHNINVNPSNLGGAQIPDFCPYQRGFSNGECTDATQQKTGANNGFAETYGSQSRCIHHGGAWSAGNSRFTPYGSGCYKYNCSGGSVTLFVLGQAFTCSQDGEVINVDVTKDGVQYRGSLVCPSCIDVCYDDFVGCPAAKTKYQAASNSPILGGNTASCLVPMGLTLLVMVAMVMGVVV